MYTEDYEQEIDLKDLLFVLLYRWRILLLAAVIGAALLGGYRAVKGNAKQMDLPQMNLADWAFDTSVIEELKLRIVDLFAGTMTPKQAADSVAAVAAEVIGE